MYFTRKIYGKTALNMNYSDEELKDLINIYFNEDGYYSYKSLCAYILNKAKENNKLDKEPNTEYSDIEISLFDADRITKILWNKIWNKEIYIDFYDNPYTSRYNNDFHFGKTKS